MLILPLKAHPLYQASWDMKGFPGTPPLVPGSSFWSCSLLSHQGTSLGIIPFTRIIITLNLPKERIQGSIPLFPGSSQSPMQNTLFLPSRSALYTGTIERAWLSHATKNILLLSSCRAKGTFFPVFGQSGGTYPGDSSPKTCSKVMTKVFYLESRLWQLVDLIAFPDNNL